MLSSFPSNRTLRPQPFGFGSPAVILLALIALLVAMVPPFVRTTPQANDVAAPPQTGPLPATPAAPPYALPTELLGKSEVATLRTAYTRTFNMGNGSFAMIQDQQPLNYQDKDGNWQPISPALAAVRGGWLNNTNTFETGLSQRSAKAKIGTQAVAVGWDPTELLIATDGQTQSVARLLDDQQALPGNRSADGQRVRFTNSWSMNGLADQWQTDRGMSQYSMLVPALPHVQLATPTNLDLRVNLHMFPGTTINVGGQPARLPLTTSAPIEFVGSDGTVLQLAPPRTYEQRRARVAVNGSYSLQGTADATVIELTVHTPWNWLANTDRQFPVIVDPLFQMRSATLMKVAEYRPFNPNDPFENYDPFDPNRFLQSTVSTSGSLGRSARVDRLLVRFDLPAMPPGSQVTKSYVYATPTDVVNGTTVGGQATFDYEHIGLANNIDLYPLSNDDWDTNGKAPVFGPAIGGPKLLSYVTANQTHQGVSWDITDVAKQWLPTPLLAINHGLMLRNENEFCEQEVLGVQIRSCGSFDFTITPNDWTADDLDTTQLLSQPGQPALPATAKGGLRLVTFYSGATLVENQPVAMMTLPQGDPPYYHADHVYGVPPLPNDHWQALVARAFGPTQGGTPSSIGDAQKAPLEGSIPMVLRSENEGLQWAAVQPSDKTVGYILLDGRGTTSDPTRKFQLHLKPTTLSPEPVRYDMRLMSETGSLTPNNGPVSTNYTFDSNDPLALWNLVLPAGSNNRVDIDVFNDGTLENSYIANAKAFAPQVFGSTGQLDFGTSENGTTISKLATNGQMQSNGPGKGPSMKFHGAIFTAQANRQYALGLAYNGPQIYGYGSTGFCGEFPCPPQVTPIKFNLTVRVTSCTNGAFPTSAGTCEVVYCPTDNAFAPNANPNNYRQLGGLGLWNQGGWSSASSPASTLHPANSSAPMIGGINRAAATVAVIGGTVSYDTSNNSVKLSTDSTVLLVNCEVPSNNNPTFTKYFDVFDGGMQRSTVIGRSVFSILVPVANSGPPNADPWPTADRAGGDLTNETFRVYPGPGLAQGTTDLNRVLQIPEDQVVPNGPTTVDLVFAASWSFDVDGWSSLTSSIAQKPNNAQPPTMASLQPALGQTLSLDTMPVVDPNNLQVQRSFTALRASAGTITQGAKLGGASKAIQVIIMPRGKPVPSDPPMMCLASCMDLRPLTDKPTLPTPDRVWDAPNVHTNSKAGSIVMSKPGELLVWSKDHPNAHLQGDSFSGEYSFDAFGASVSVTQEACDKGGPKVTVVKGQTGITLPNIGDGAGGAGIAASFKICETKLRMVKLSFSSPVGIPLGSTGLFLTGLSGEVDIEATYTKIIITINWAFGSPGSDGTASGTGQITIDTRGLVDLQASAKLLGSIDANGELWVAWNPLDVGLKLHVGYKDWLTGDFRAHMWQGQGWQNKYKWLPDNKAIHMAADISAKITIKKGAIADWAILSLPPSDIVFGIEIAFGQFCTNPKCTAYEWGIKGKLTILSYDIGLYFGFDHGFDFILGTDHHLLIDEYGGTNGGPIAPQVMGNDASDEVQAAPAAVNGTALIPITVAASSKQLLFALGWQAGAPKLSLIDPHGTEITGANAAAHNVQVSNTGTMSLMTVQSPDAGQWQAKIAQLSANGVEHYKFMYFASKGQPGTPQDPAIFTKPSQSMENGNDAYTITWNVPANSPPKSTISLFYTKAEGVTPQPQGANLEQDVPIVKNLPFSAGSYTWDTSTRASGTYTIRAEVDDGVNDFTGEISDPDNTCLPQSSTLPGPRAYDPNRFPGTVVFTSTGSIEINDVTPPAAPTGLLVTPIDSTLLARWTPPAARDTTRYLVRWGLRTGTTFTPINEELVTTVTTPTMRIGAVDNGKEYGVDVIAIDASGNQSAASTPAFGIPDAVNTLPMTPTNFLLTGKTATSASFSWAPGAGPAPASYRLTWRQLGVNGAYGQTDEATTSGTLSNLVKAGTYSVSVSALSSDGWASPDTAPIKVVLTNGVDADNDGLPDDWEQAYGVHGASADPDGDGLTNQQEFQNGTDPTQQDTDADGWSDKEEVLAGTDPLSINSHPAAVAQPRLWLAHDRLHFVAKRTDASVPTQTINWSNIGGGTLNLTPSSTSPWITTSVVTQTLQIGVSTGGLQPGFYSGVVKLSNTTGDVLIGGSNCVRVSFWLLPADTDIPTPTPTGVATTPTPTGVATTPTPGGATPTPTIGVGDRPSRLYVPVIAR